MCDAVPANDIGVAANIYQAVKQAMQDLVAPQLESLRGDIGALRAEVHGNHAALSSELHRIDDKLTAEIQRVDGKLTAEIQRVDGKLTSEIRRIDDKLTWALDLRERIVAIETKLAIS